MALVNIDGTVSKAWPVDTTDSKGNRISGHSTNRGLMYEPFQTGKAEPVNLQLGHFGISAWPSDTGGTSNASSVDEARGDITDIGSRYYSSCCSSPRISTDGPAKEPKEEDAVHGSDEEVDDPPVVDSDEYLSDDGRNERNEEGANTLMSTFDESLVDEESTKSDEEYDDLAMQDSQDNGYASNDDVVTTDILASNFDGAKILGTPDDRDKNRPHIGRILRSRSESLSELPCSYSSLLKEKNETRVATPGNVKSSETVL